MLVQVIEKCHRCGSDIHTETDGFQAVVHPTMGTQYWHKYCWKGMCYGNNLAVQATPETRRH